MDIDIWTKNYVVSLIIDMNVTDEKKLLKSSVKGYIEMKESVNPSL